MNLNFDTIRKYLERAQGLRPRGGGSGNNHDSCRESQLYVFDPFFLHVGGGKEVKADGPTLIHLSGAHTNPLVWGPHLSTCLGP